MTHGSRCRVPLFFAVLAAAAATAAPADLMTQQRARQHYQAGQDLLLADAFAKAAEEFRAAIALDPRQPLPHYGLGQAYMGMKSYAEAVAAYRKCRLAYEELAADEMNRGSRLNVWIEDEIRALRDLKTQIETRLRQSGAGAPNSLLQRELIRVTHRLEQLDRLRLRQGPVSKTPPGVALALGSAYLRSGNLAEAEREYEVALEGNPKMGEAHNNLAYVYMVTGRLQDAERALRLAEKNGFRVNPDFKTELKQKLQ